MMIALTDLFIIDLGAFAVPTQCSNTADHPCVVVHMIQFTVHDIIIIATAKTLLYDVFAKDFNGKHRVTEVIAVLFVVTRSISSGNKPIWVQNSGKLLANAVAGR